MAAMEVEPEDERHSLICNITRHAVIYKTPRSRRIRGRLCGWSREGRNPDSDHGGRPYSFVSDCCALSINLQNEIITMYYAPVRHDFHRFFPELDSLVVDPADYLRVVRRIIRGSEARDVTFSDGLLLDLQQEGLLVTIRPFSRHRHFPPIFTIINYMTSNNHHHPITDDDDSSYFTFFQQDTSTSISIPPPEMPPPKKRRKSDNKKKRSIARLLTSLAALDAQEASDRRDFDEASRRDLSLLQANLDQQSAALLSYHSHLHDSYSDLEDSDATRCRRARLAAAAAAAAAADPAVSGAAVQNSAGGGQKRLWVKDRSRIWWDRYSHPDCPDTEFRKAFRMGRETFEVICKELKSAVEKEDTMLRAAIPVDQRVAVCIWRLATGEPLRLVSNRFGLGISTCHKLVLEVCSAIKAVLMPKFLQWPDQSKAESVKSRFEAVSGIPSVIGSMYTTHIPIIAPKISVAAYFNRRHTERNQKTSYSITVQGVVDPDGVFTDVCIGWPGSMPDDQVLEKSALYQRANAGMMKDTWIVGSTGYPLMDWVLVPYTHQNLTWTQHAFNEKIGEVQRTAREAFARLKGRWSCLQKRTEVKLQDLPVVLGACCVLHNICEMRKEGIDPELGCDLVDDEMVPDNCLRSVSSMQARDNIAHNLLHHGLAGTKFF